MTITPDNSRGRFWVESLSEREHVHLVDLVSFNGIGECGCDDWKFRCQPAIKKGLIARCKHIMSVREYLVEKTNPELCQRDRETVVNKAIKLWIQEEAG